jgi:hypothetical protein
MKALGEASYIIGIKLLRDRHNRMIGLSQAPYMDKDMARFSMLDSKKGLLPFRHGVPLTKEQCPKTPQEEENEGCSLSFGCRKPHVCYAM